MADIKKYIVYKYTSPSNKIYIGQTSQTIIGRAGTNGQKYWDSPLFYNAIKKYGYKNFSNEVLLSNLTLEEANYWEAYYINKYHSNDPQYGYNLTTGGDGQYKVSNATREKMRLSHLGLKHTEEAKAKIGKIHKGKKLSEETKNKISQTRIKKQIPSPMLGKKHSQETKEKIGKANGYLVICEETGIIYDSAAEAGRQLNISPTHVRRCCRGECKSAKGYHLHYYREE